MAHMVIEAEVRLARSGVAEAADGAPLRLTYDLRPCSGVQPRVRGRLVAVPRLDMSDYTVSACVDWVELKFQTSSKSQNRHVSEKLARFSPRPPHVTDWQGRQGREAGTHDKFVVRLQEPGIDVLGVADAISAQWGLVGAVKISGIEISLDIFPNDGSDEKRWLMATMLTRAYWPLRDHMAAGNDQARCIASDARGEPSVTPLVRRIVKDELRSLVVDPANHNAPLADATTSFGAVGGPVMVSIQDKVSDRRIEGTATPLPQEAKRTRLEVRLLGEGLGVLGMEVLGDLDMAGRAVTFQDLRKDLFGFRLATFDPLEAHDAERRTMFSKIGVYGLERHEQMRRDVMRCAAGPTLAFKELNERLRQALQRLDHRWSSTRGAAA